MSRLGFTPGMFGRPLRLAPPKISGGGGSPPTQITDGAATYNGSNNNWLVTFTPQGGVTYDLKVNGSSVGAVSGPAYAIANDGTIDIGDTLRVDGTNANGTTNGATFSPTAPAQTGTANPMEDLFRVAGNLNGDYPDSAGNNTWSTSGGTWTKAAGEAQISSGSGPHIWAYYDAGISDCTIVAEVHTAVTGTYLPGVAFRCVGGLGWYFEIRDGGWYLNYQGTDPVANDPGWGAANDTAYQLKVVLSGNDITLYIDNVQVHTLSDSRDASSTTHGLHSYDDGSYADNGSNFHSITINA